MKQTSTSIKSGSTLFLKTVLFLIAIIVLIGMIWFPQTEGRAAHLDLVGIYRDPFIIYLYIASIPFFVAINQAFKLLGYIEQDRVFSQVSVQTLRNIKYCVIAFIGFVALAVTYIFIMSKTTTDDGAGPITVGLVIIFASAIIATAAGVFQRLLQNAVDIKSENDLTV
jgi:hypothetical protein